MSPTLLANPRNETVQTNITYSPKTNDEFLNAIFTGLTDSQRPFVLGFSGKPKDSKAWAGGAWQLGKVGTENASQNWYFSLAVFEPAVDGYHRREKDCVAVLGVMLDDIGTKALPLYRLTACPPSYIPAT